MAGVLSFAFINAAYLADIRKRSKEFADSIFPLIAPEIKQLI